MTERQTVIRDLRNQLKVMTGDDEREAVCNILNDMGFEVGDRVICIELEESGTIIGNDGMTIDVELESGDHVTVPMGDAALIV